MVFLHGVGSSSATWRTVMTLLEDRYTVVGFDLLGHGKSPVPADPSEYSRDKALVDLDDVIASVGDSTVLIGHSLGGYLALAHAATRRNLARALVVLNTGPGFRDEVKREAWNERSRRNAHRFGVPVQATGLNIQEDGVVMESLAALTVPTLVLVGTADRPEYAGSAKYLERKMPDASFVAVQGGGHLMHEESHAGEVAELIHDFVSQLPPEA